MCLYACTRARLNKNRSNASSCERERERGISTSRARARLFCGNKRAREESEKKPPLLLISRGCWFFFFFLTLSRARLSLSLRRKSKGPLKRGEISPTKKSAQKIQKEGNSSSCENLRGKEGNKKNLHTHTHSAVFLAHGFIPRAKPQKRAKQKEIWTTRATLFLPSLARDGSPSVRRSSSSSS